MLTMRLRHRAGETGLTGLEFPHWLPVVVLVL